MKNLQYILAFLIGLLICLCFKQYQVPTNYNVPANIISDSINSKILEQQVDLKIYRSKRDSTGNQPKSVIFLLHGLDGSALNWINKADIITITDSLTQLGELPDLLLVMPNSSNCYYINNYDQSIRYEDFMVKELIPYIDKYYLKNTSYKNHMVMGYSMGGFGAIMQGIKHPKIYSTIVALSPAVRTDSILMALPDLWYNKYFGNIYGPNLKDSARITEHWKLNSPYYCINDSVAKHLRKMNWYFECGTEDYLFPASKAIDKLFNSYTIPHTLNLRSGDHNFEFWRKGAIHGLLYIGKLQEVKNSK